MRDRTLNENVYEVGLHAGAALAIEMVVLYGPEIADSVTGKSISKALSDEQQEILYDAVQRAVALMLPPDDPSPLPAPETPVSACHRPDCTICAGIA